MKKWKREHTSTNQCNHIFQGLKLRLDLQFLAKLGVLCHPQGHITVNDEMKQNLPGATLLNGHIKKTNIIAVKRKLEVVTASLC